MIKHKKIFFTIPFLTTNFTQIRYNNRGSAQQARNHLDDALKDYSKAIQLDTEYAKAFYNRGGLYDVLGKFPEALEDYNHAIKLDPEYVNALNNRADVSFIIFHFMFMMVRYI